MALPDVSAHVSIAEAMLSLRAQITEAAAQSPDDDLRFTVREIEMEFQIALTTTVEGSAKATIWSVVTFGAGASRATEDTHRVRLVLEPHRDENGKRRNVELGE